jgi:hypothetical protein
MTRRIFAIGLILALCAAVPAAADTTEIGQIKTLKGDVYIFRGGERLVASAGDLLHQADVLETGADGSVGITFIDSSRFSAGPDTRLELTQFRFNPTTQDGNFTMDMKRGTVSVVSGQIAKQAPDAMKIVTPTTILGFRGTRVAVKVTE